MKELSESRVLVVDDSEANVDVLVEALRGEYKLSVAMDGEAALRSIEKSPPDIVLLDIMMPGIDGYEVCRRIRANEAWHDLPVMFLSSLEDARDKARGPRLPGGALRPHARRATSSRRTSSCAGSGWTSTWSGCSTSAS